MNDHPPLTAADREALAHEIAQRRSRTRARISQLERDLEALVEATHDSPDDEHDPEGATIGFERAQAGALLAEAVQLLSGLDRAETALVEGEIGHCRDCSRPIGVDRLLARPTTSTCVGCAT